MLPTTDYCPVHGYHPASIEHDEDATENQVTRRVPSNNFDDVKFSVIRKEEVHSDSE